ncbi:hypothetical protein HAX54_038005, partial [Datura stramonium]|nr:hypothetical protein [Datura stramonium]
MKGVKARKISNGRDNLWTVCLRRSVSSIIQFQQKIPKTKLTGFFNDGLKDGPSFQKMVPQLKDRLKLVRSRILKCGARDEPSFPKMVYRPMDKKLVDRSQIAEYGSKDGPYFQRTFHYCTLDTL